ncbi:hypothetical protein V496_09576 [Pseudogymnoascus sp. VKM F-4515 (FW-2607)]|nr:hypothetical protein V496_09576 [Pseudogymnoascus sp. VKM F-4515 (FW-2607)]
MASTHSVQIDMTSYHPSSATATGVESLQNDLDDPSNSNQEFSLSPTDGGKDAWLCLCACFMLEALIWGFPSCYGVFQEYYSTSEEFAGSSNIAVVGTCAMGIMYMDISIWFAVLKYFPNFRKWATPVGLAIVCLALGLGSFSTTVGHLIITQGIIYALGGGLAFTPILFYIEEWWVRRRGFAYGTTMAGLGLSGAILPVVLEWLLRSYGFRTTLRVCASANIIQSLGYFIPGIYLPGFARSIGASSIESTATVVLINGAAFFGCLCMGMAVDKYHVVNCLLVSAIGSGAGIVLLWGFSSSLGTLYAFCLIYGVFAGCQSSAWSAVVRDTIDKRRGADSGMVWACLSAGRGVGNLCSGPVSEALFHSGNWNAVLAYGSGYGALIAFTGATAMLSGWAYAAKRIGWL